MTPQMTPTERHQAALDRRAAGEVPRLWGAIVNLQGYPVRAVLDLNPNAEKHPRMKEFHFITERGRWVNLATADEGDGFIALIAWLGSCSRHVAAAFLEAELAKLEPEGVT